MKTIIHIRVLEPDNGVLIYSEDTYSIEQAEESLGRAQSFLKKYRPDLLETEKVIEF